MSRIILFVLRQAAEPLTTRDIALQLLVERALDKSEQRLLRLMTKRVGVALWGCGHFGNETGRRRRRSSKRRESRPTWGAIGTLLTAFNSHWQRDKRSLDHRAQSATTDRSR